MQIDRLTAFVSDVHLSDQDPATAQDFFSQLSAYKGKLSKLIVLGDLFDTWVGDDCVDDTPAGQLAASTFTLFKSLACPVYFCAGNRDFLLGVDQSGSKGSTAFGMQLLVEQTTATFTVNGDQAFNVLLCHGDEFCLDDKVYQQVRKTLRSELWQKQFLSKSLVDRRTQALHMRAQSRQEQIGKPSDIMDVNSLAVAHAFSDSEVSLIIHGHTHRPKQHDDSHSTRVVLPDWDAATQRGQVYFISSEIADRYAHSAQHR